jgi:signal transduction histidine kinase
MLARSADSSDSETRLGSEPVARTTAPTVRSTGETVSGASRRLRALSALSGSLTDALAPEEAANLVEQKAMSALGATSAVVVTFGPFPPVVSLRMANRQPPVLTVLHAVGLPAEVKALIDQLPFDAPVPLAEVAREGAPIFLSSERELLEYPSWGAAMIAAGARAAAIVPVWANGELRGVLGLAWTEPRIFDEDECAFVLTLGVMCAQAIMRAHLRAAEHRSSLAAVAAREIAEIANRSKALFVATVSHELRTPMNAVLGYTQLISDEHDGPVTPLQREHLGRVSASGKHLLGLIEQLLGYARVEAGEEVVRSEPVILSELVEQSLSLVRPLAEQRGLRLRVEGPSEPVELHTDPGKVRQILVNLLANAVKFSSHGEVVLLLRVDGVDAAVRVHFEVTDTGSGIALEDHQRVFEPFWQVHPASPHSEAGSTGLGLSVARQLARLLGGDVVVAASALGKGSTFILSLPARFVAPEAPASAIGH